MDSYKIHRIAVIQSDFTEKFGVPRQSSLVTELFSKIIFDKKYRTPNAIRELDNFSHIWLLWLFSESIDSYRWSPTIRPPRLGGNKRIGVFASRSPFRPNHIGLSSVRLEGIDEDPNYGPILTVSGADLVNGTPIIDIKPYIPYSDCHPNAIAGYVQEAPNRVLTVYIPPELKSLLGIQRTEGLRKALALDPRPQYQKSSQKVYGMSFAGYNIKFQITDDKLSVTDFSPAHGNM